MYIVAMLYTRKVEVFTYRGQVCGGERVIMRVYGRVGEREEEKRYCGRKEGRKGKH